MALTGPPERATARTRAAPRRARADRLPCMRLTSVLANAGLVLWAGYELLLRHRDRTAASWRAGAADRGSTALLPAAFAGALLLGALLPGALPAAARWAGVGAVAAGLLLRAWGMRTLGAYYTRTLRTAPGQRVVRTGPYRLIRHPGYAGSLLVWTGWALGLGKGLAAVAVAVLLGAAYGWRIAAEERILLAVFGEEYAEYRRRTKRLLPYVY
ncbi:isoprenylcysteine carboxylmethyltransferase family protein [Streptomyces clavuligerus]|uniref:Isoprenylcysteine carboxyl methyltransferase n=2 Tax=Streptomyces clavuligerus TaxID=1901 RepID=E2Q569_STRCL|nr:isoprenylcysteine carboxyl methyltransferase [Streptomyces clavuligerus]AXU14628.1 isoprenylcysteine carboxylmethyltransferase family protein [Streptomyces clavuligerus]EFG07110.1 Isoprenylcysteine carboxyl methyltransferase [Streptomyces clavuligerus]MBY6304641.1 isoprenylcysteine carboxylmethyltransferase family protein [Streptomyces clavuligerus]QCS07399.1 isoprenylcysteine carboxylmethyltransferase family protein [Streptomyces clavuligerus]